MIDITKIDVGFKVYYHDDSYQNKKFENGIIKEIPDWTTKQVRVVYNWGEDWKNYRDYTSQLTNVSDLHLGWINLDLDKARTK